MLELSARSRTPVYRLVVHQIHAESYWTKGWAPPGRSMVICSAVGYGETTHAIQIGDSIRVSGGSITPHSWSVSVGGFAIELCGVIGLFFDRCSRGAICSLEMGFVGWAEDQFERIALGRYQHTESSGLGRAVRHSATFWGVGALLQTRIAETYTKTALFATLEDTTDLSSTYNGTAGTLDVSSSGALQRETGGTGVVEIHPSSGSSSYYVKWTNVSTNTLTISPSSELFSTARSVAAAGSIVDNVAYLSGHPLDIMLKILISGNGSASVYNKYPSEWGYRLPVELVAISDILLWRAGLTSSSGYDWEYLVTDPQDNGWTWLTGLLAVDGIWPVFRQGQISARYAQNIWSMRTPPALQITESQQMGEYRLIDWDPEHSVEYGQLNIRNKTAHTVGAAVDLTKQLDPALESMPLARSADIDLTDRIYDNSVGDGVRPIVADRLSNWAFRICERLILTTGLSSAQLCPGDVVLVTLPSIQGRIQETRYGYQDQPCMVASIDVDYTAGTCSLELLTHSEAT